MKRRPTLMIVTDLDGTLLDPETYDPGPATPVLARLRALGVPVVPCSSKTRAEIELLMSSLGLDGPFVCENGGAVHLPASWVQSPQEEADHLGARADDRRRWTLRLGRPYADVVATLRDVASGIGVGVRGFADMSVAEVARVCGLTPLQAQLARLREFDEPFVVESPDARVTERLLKALARRGVRTLEGGRFHHAVGETDKGHALTKFRGLVARRGPVILAGLGDAPNDLDLLEQADVPVAIRGAKSERLLDACPAAASTTASGPAGWAEAVTSIVDRWEGGLWPGTPGRSA